MARSVVGYVRQFLNKSASASFTQSVEATTGLPVHTGMNTGVWQEFSDGEALAYSSRQIVSVQILTAGSGQTPGTYALAASAGGAVISVVVAAGGTVTAIPTVTTGGLYTTDTAPTVTLAAGGTPATFSLTVGYLYNGVYAWVALDPAVTGSILVGQPLYWLATSSTFTVTTTATGNYPDLAGFSIDPGFSAAFPNAFIQMTGKAKALFDATNSAALGSVINVQTSPGATVTSVASAWTNVSIGTSLQVGTTLSPGLIRIQRPQNRF